MLLRAHATDLNGRCEMQILCGTDLLPKTESALDRAGMLAERLGAELSLLHVAVPTESDRMLEEDVQRARALLQARATSPLWRYGPPPEVCIRSGSPAHVLIEVAQEVDTALVILGTHRTRPARDALAGTIAMRLLSALTCPVLIVRRMPWGPYSNILMALDRSEASAETVRAAEALVIRPNARTSVVHAYQPPHSAMMTSAGIAGDVIDTYLDGWKREASAAMRDLLMQVSKDASRYELVLENATTTAAVGRVMGRLKPDLLVLGTRGCGRLRRAFLGSVANRVIAATRSDVLIVPQRKTETAWQRGRSERRALDVVMGV
jgi:universal stress protein E